MFFCLGINQLGNGLGVWGGTESWAGAFGDLGTQWNLPLLGGNIPLLDKNRQVKTGTLKQLGFKFYYFVKISF